jgi:protein SCO1/2
MSLSRLRLVLWLLVGAAALTATGLYVYTTMAPPPQQADSFGKGNYQLVSASGEPFTHDSLVGKPSMLFFGFTHCPDVCPTSLAEMVTWYEALGDEARDLNAWFITVDPERDTAEVIGDYVSWTERVTGVTGTPDEIASVARAWGAHFEKVPLEGGDYTMDHTASIYLINAQGEFEGTIAYRESTQTALGKLRRLLAS